MTALWVIHDLGDPHGGVRWEEQLRAAGWDGDLVVPRLPGHGGEPLSPGGWLARVEGAFTAARLLVDHPSPDDRIVVGVGRSGWSAQSLALGGCARGLVLVDGLGGPFLAPSEVARRFRAALRALVAAGDDPGSGPTDARASIFPLDHHDLDLAQEAADAIEVPTLLCETDVSPNQPHHVDELAKRYANAELRRGFVDADEAALAADIVGWASQLAGAPGPSA